MLLALGAIALGSMAASSEAAAQTADSEYQKQCDWLSQQSAASLEQFIQANPNDTCVKVAAALLAERIKPALGGGFTAGHGRY